MPKKDIPESLQIYTLQEVAEILKVNVRTIHRYLESGQLEAIKMGGRQWRVTKEALERFLYGEREAGASG